MCKVKTDESRNFKNTFYNNQGEKREILFEDAVLSGRWIVLEPEVFINQHYLLGGYGGEPVLAFKTTALPIAKAQGARG